MLDLYNGIKLMIWINNQLLENPDQIIDNETIKF